jgi:hypothetical protein
VEVRSVRVSVQGRGRQARRAAARASYPSRPPSAAAGAPRQSSHLRSLSAHGELTALARHLIKSRAYPDCASVRMVPPRDPSRAANSAFRCSHGAGDWWQAAPRVHVTGRAKDGLSTQGFEARVENLRFQSLRPSHTPPTTSITGRPAPIRGAGAAWMHRTVGQIVAAAAVVAIALRQSPIAANANGFITRLQEA